MDIEEIIDRVHSIKLGQDDDEVAHADEDALMMDFIKHVRDTGDARLSAMAAEVLKTGDISFARWCG